MFIEHLRDVLKCLEAPYDQASSLNDNDCGEEHKTGRIFGNCESMKGQ